MSVVKTARGRAGTFDPRLSGKGVGGFLQEPFAEVDTRSPASPGAWHEDRRPDGSLLFVLSSESSRASAQPVGAHRPIAMWSCARNPDDDSGGIASHHWMTFSSFVLQ